MSRRLVLVSGMSGAGRSTALDVLEDAGFEAVDNLPLYLVERLAEPAPEAAGQPAGRPPQASQGTERLAIGVDVRSRGFAAGAFAETLERLRRHPGLAVELLYLDCDSEVLIRRYTETRRRHPLAGDRPAADGIAAERQLLAPVRALADLVIDTSVLQVADLRARLLQTLVPEGQALTITVQSFSFRRGVPREADLVFDVRFLRNPHYDPQLRPKTGRDADVGAHIEGDPAFAGFFAQLGGLLLPLLPRYRAEGKSYLTICIGCTGGRHRSVYIAGRLATALREAGWPVALTHRDLPPDEAPNEAPDGR
ncbi:MAG: RNase adapter RapZ [Alphaproteobacteria bacterium]